MAEKKSGVKQKEKVVMAAAGKVQVAASKQERDELIRKQIVEADGALSENYLALSEGLYEAYHREYYKEKWGYATWEDYCNKELTTHYRKAMNLVEIWDKVKSLNLPHDKVVQLGWTKMKDIASVITEKNAKQWLAKAEKMTSRELTEAVRTVRKKDTSGTEVPTITTMTFRMSEAEASVITDAIEVAKRLCGSDNAVVALEMVCQDWMEAKGQQPERAKLEDTVKYLEAVYGVAITWKQVPKNKKPTLATADMGATREASKKNSKKSNGKGVESTVDEDADAPSGGVDINKLLEI
jgi:hypothetical protein